MRYVSSKIKKGQGRFWEVDALRGIALTTMIIYHAVFSLNMFAGTQFDLSSPFWFYFQRGTACTFIFLAGVSLVIATEGPAGKKIMPSIRRGIKIFLWGMVVTAVTWLVLASGKVVFGILHFIGTAVILALPFARLPAGISGALGLACIVAGQLLGKRTFGFSWLLWLGFVPANFYTIDYFPLLPWFGVVLFGIAVGRLLYAGKRRRFSLPDWSGFGLFRLFSFMGRHSLTIYLVHVPVILLFMVLLGLTDIRSVLGF